jgi:hypothetical protein
MNGQRMLETDHKKQASIEGNGPRLYGLRIPSFRIRARNVLRLSPRISAAPPFPLTFH